MGGLKLPQTSVLGRCNAWAFEDTALLCILLCTDNNDDDDDIGNGGDGGGGDIIWSLTPPGSEMQYPCSSLAYTQ